MVGFDHQYLFLMPIEYTEGLGPGDTVIPLGQDTSVPVGEELLGRVVNGVASPLDGKGPIRCDSYLRLHGPVINPLSAALFASLWMLVFVPLMACSQWVAGSGWDYFLPLVWVKAPCWA